MQKGESASNGVSIFLIKNFDINLGFNQLNKVMIENAQLLPFEVNKIWIHDHPNVPRNWHLALNNTKKPLLVPFDVLGIPMQYPGDPIGGPENNIGCKCSMLIVPRKDEDGNLIYS